MARRSCSNSRRSPWSRISRPSKAAEKVDLMLAPVTAFAGRLAREKHGTPLITVHLQPAVFLSVHETPLLHPAMRLLRAMPVWFKTGALLAAEPRGPLRAAEGAPHLRGAWRQAAAQPLARVVGLAGWCAGAVSEVVLCAAARLAAKSAAVDFSARRLGEGTTALTGCRPFWPRVSLRSFSHPAARMCRRRVF
jgi:hypothetical protein